MSVACCHWPGVTSDQSCHRGHCHSSFWRKYTFYINISWHDLCRTAGLHTLTRKCKLQRNLYRRRRTLLKKKLKFIWFSETWSLSLLHGGCLAHFILDRLYKQQQLTVECGIFLVQVIWHSMYCGWGSRSELVEGGISGERDAGVATWN